MKKKYLFFIGIAIIISAIIFFALQTPQNIDIETVVKKGSLKIEVVATGELQAENSEDILGPSGLRTIRIWNVKITDLIEEGTIIDSGDYVGMLDRSEVESKLKDIEAELESAQSQFIKTQLDTTMNLRALRDALINLQYSVEEARLTLEQSVYEPPATVRQSEIKLDKAQREYKQAIENYTLKKKQAVTEMQEASLLLNTKQRLQESTLEIISEFEIKAPKPGMLIYFREWNGQKRKIGSSISTWDPVVATLPDLTSMVSETYINEIDISKVKNSQEVAIKVDAFPEKLYTGKIIEIANIGEQLPNSDAKVFKVLIKVNESDTILRPAMTTANTIATNIYHNVLFIPIEALHTNDSSQYVYQRAGFKLLKKQVEAGEANENEIIIKKGLQENEKILLSIPEDETESIFIPL